MVNYKQGKIYKIECNVTGLIYIGSTCKKKLSQRMTEHRSNYKKYLNGKKKYYSAFIVMKNDDYDIILIEDFPCNSKDQLFARERYHTNKIECVNICKNQGLCLELGKKKYKQEYNQINKEHIKEYKQEYNQINKEHIKEYNQEYKQINKEHIKEYNREYREINDDYRKKKFTCLCGGKYTCSNKSFHIKTKMDQKYLEEQTENDN